MDMQTTFNFDDEPENKEKSLYAIATAEGVPYDVAYIAAARALKNDTIFSRKRERASDCNDKSNYIFSPQEVSAIRSEIAGAFVCCFNEVRQLEDVTAARNKYPMYKRYIKN